MNYTLTKDGGINELTIPTDGQWGTICFAWEDSNVEFTTALAAKGIRSGEFNDCNYIYGNMDSYDKMMYSFKPLKPKYWISEEYYEIKSK